MSTLRRSVVVIAALLALAAPASANVLPPGGRPYGQSYGQWQVAWWQWVLAQPTDHNPVTDTTGADCARGQQGPVWYLAGTFGGPPVTRNCTIPAGRALLLPVANNAYFAFTDDPPETRTEDYVRSRAREITDATNLAAAIDGRRVNDIARYYTDSPLFRVVLGDGNLFGLPTGFVLDPSVDAGYYLIVTPLSRGCHTITFSAQRPGGFMTNVTYHLRVGPST
jgi:hypothetical protein